MTLKKLIITYFLISSTACAAAAAPYTLILDPAGHAKHLGRKLKDGYERGATLKFAEKLQRELHYHNNTNVIISRRPGEELKPLEVASFANRLHAQLVINLQIYHTNNAKPSVHLYHFCHNPFTELSKQLPAHQLAFVPLRQAHLVSMQQTKHSAAQLHKILSQPNNTKLFSTQTPIALPLKPLLGITASALTIEIGINEENKLESLVNPLAQALKKVIATTVIN